MKGIIDFVLVNFNKILNIAAVIIIACFLMLLLFIFSFYGRESPPLPYQEIRKPLTIPTEEKGGDIKDRKHNTEKTYLRKKTTTEIWEQYR